MAVRLREGLVNRLAGYVDTLRSMCKAAIDNILQVHPVFLRVLHGEHGVVAVLRTELQSSMSDL